MYGQQNIKFVSWDTRKINDDDDDDDDDGDNNNNNNNDDNDDDDGGGGGGGCSGGGGGVGGGGVGGGGGGGGGGGIGGGGDGGGDDDDDDDDEFVVDLLFRLYTTVHYRIFWRRSGNDFEGVAGANQKWQLSRGLGKATKNLEQNILFPKLDSNCHFPNASLQCRH